jgi:hypothetical protein
MTALLCADTTSLSVEMPRAHYVSFSACMAARMSEGNLATACIQLCSPGQQACWSSTLHHAHCGFQRSPALICVLCTVSL